MVLGSRAARGAVGIIVAGLMASCGGEDREPAAAGVTSREQAPLEIGESSNRRPVVERVSLVPAKPTPGHVVRAEVGVVDPEGDAVRLGYRWKLAGRPLGEGHAEVELRNAARGDELMVVVTPSDAGGPGESYTQVVQLVNRPPKMLGVAIEGAREVKPGADLVASPKAHDADGDHLEYRYEWRVNGRAVDADESLLSTRVLQRGDRVEVTAVADDGTDESEPLTSKAVTISNSPPEIVSGPSWQKEDGVFRYQVEARDPDGDRSLRYRLLDAPPGMQVDPLLGAVSWKPGFEDDGAHVVRLEVDDLRGGTTVQTFELTVRVEDVEADEARPGGAPSDGDRERGAAEAPASPGEWD